MSGEPGSGGGAHRVDEVEETDGPHGRASVSDVERNGYWRAMLRLVTGLLLIWFVSSFVVGILLVEQLNRISLGGFPLGFWFAQQGSMYIFIVLVFVYARRADAIAREHGVD